MPEAPRPAIVAAEVVLPCTDLDATLTFFCERLRFRVDAVHPADDPDTAVVSGHGVRIRLQRGHAGAPGVLRLRCSDVDGGSERSGELVAPNGTRVEFVAAQAPLVLPPLQPAFVLSRREGAVWRAGRAGMRYRDLLPGRQGGRFVASQIEIRGAGPVPDYVHFHRVHWQLIYCSSGEVQVVYEDQGEARLLRAGDAVLQPPEIRHRVLASSGDSQVIEVTCPAAHETIADHDLTLPTPDFVPARTFAGQRFVHHRAEGARWRPLPGHFAERDLGIADATGGLAAARVLRAHRRDGSARRRAENAGELLLVVVLAGRLSLEAGPFGTHELAAGDACAVPPGTACDLAPAADAVEVLEVSAPAARGES